MRNITSGGSDESVVGTKVETNRVRVWDNKKNFENYIIDGIITSKDSLSLKIGK